jgi:hypothetical protein
VCVCLGTQPANIFLTLDGTVKVGDLGLGRMFSADTIQAFSKVRSYTTVGVLAVGAKHEGHVPPALVGHILFIHTR